MQLTMVLIHCAVNYCYRAIYQINLNQAKFHNPLVMTVVFGTSLSYTFIFASAPPPTQYKKGRESERERVQY